MSKTSEYIPARRKPVNVDPHKPFGLDIDPDGDWKMEKLPDGDARVTYKGKPAQFDRDYIDSLEERVDRIQKGKHPAPRQF